MVAMTTVHVSRAACASACRVSSSQTRSLRIAVVAGNRTKTMRPLIQNCRRDHGAYSASKPLGQRTLAAGGGRMRQPAPAFVPDRERRSRPAPVCVRRRRESLALQRFRDRAASDRSRGLLLNITAPDPRIFVMWRFFDDGAMPAARPVLVTVSYNQAGRYMDGGETGRRRADAARDRRLDAAFIAVHYEPEPRRKVRRNDPRGATESAAIAPGVQEIDADGRRRRRPGRFFAATLVAAQARRRARRNRRRIR